MKRNVLAKPLPGLLGRIDGCSLVGVSQDQTDRNGGPDGLRSLGGNPDKAVPVWWKIMPCGMRVVAPWL